MIILQIANSFLSIDEFSKLVIPVENIELLEKNDIKNYIPEVEHKSLDPNLMVALISTGISGGFTILAVLLQAFLTREKEKRFEKDKLGLNGIPTIIINYTELNTDKKKFLEIQSDEKPDEIINKLRDLVDSGEKSSDARIDLSFWD